MKHNIAFTEPATTSLARQLSAATSGRRVYALARLRASAALTIWLLAAWVAPSWAQSISATLPVASDALNISPIAVNRVTNKLYVASDEAGGFDPGIITVIDGNTHEVTTIQAGRRPWAIAVNEVTNKIYVANLGRTNLLDPSRGSITVIDGATAATTTVVDPNAHGPASVAVNAATNKIYVANDVSGNVTVIDGATNSITTVTDPNAARYPLFTAVAIDPAINKIYVVNGVTPNSCGNVTVIDGASNTTRTIADPHACGPIAVAVNTTTHKVYVANNGDGSANRGNVTVVDGLTNAIETVTDPHADLPYAIAVDSTANKVYVANVGSHNVSVIDGVMNAVTTVTDPSAVRPEALVVNETANAVYVANAGCNSGCVNYQGPNNPGSVTVIKGGTYSTTTIIDAKANSPRAVSVNAADDLIYVLNGGSENLTIIDGSLAPTTHTLAVLPAGNGAGTVSSSPPGIDCGASCYGSFPLGTAIALNALASSGSGFVGWGGSCAGTGSCDLMVTQDQFVTATFAQLVKVPDEVGASQARAERAIAGAGLVVGTVTQQSSSTTEAGAVISESPAAGVDVMAGSAVNLVVSSGAPPRSGGGGGIDSITMGALLLGVLMVARRRVCHFDSLATSQEGSLSMNSMHPSSLRRVTPMFGLVLVSAALLAAGPASHAAEAPSPVHYRVQSLPNQGGLYNATSINDQRWIAGLVTPPGDAVDHAALWRHGALTDLGTLGGPNSSVAFPMKNSVGWLAGGSEVAQTDPNAENFCGFTCSALSCAPYAQICRGFLWQDKTRKMIPLPSLPAGPNSIAYGANNGEIVGVSENGVADVGCQLPQVFDFEGVVWRLDSSATPFIAKRLRPLEGDVVSAAIQINQVGIAVGGSGRCAPLGPALSAHAVMWAPDGQPTDLGSLGGVTNNVAFAINDQGQIIGISDLPGDQVTHSFLWQHGHMQDLGTLRPGDVFVFASSINNIGEVVGNSCGVIDCGVFHWQKGVMIDLNTALVGVPAGFYVLSANDINDRGEIAAAAFDPSFGDQVGVVLAPIEGEGN